jgi:DNA invertase Pin-like site-specific DNA recombinase
MTEAGKVKLTHTRRTAFVYIRQSSPQQVENNRESTARQYALVEKACELGWAREQVTVVDEDLGLSGSGTVKRSGFARMTAEVALGHVGIVLGLEVSRLARNNADWYRLLDLCGMTDTLIGDSDGIYHPAAFNDRLILGLKGTMSEAELHILRARLEGGIRNKAARGELRRGLPVGFVWGEGDGEVGFDPNAAVVGAIRTVFAKFTELDRRARYGSGFAPKVLASLFAPTCTVRFAGLLQRIPPSIPCSPIRCMLAHMRTVSAAMNAMSMNKAGCADGRAICHRLSGPCFFPSTTRGSLTGRHTRQTRRASTPTFILNLTRQAAL